jgi:NADPH:quinone reductase-like Zn-dependent oxidoreductase
VALRGANALCRLAGRTPTVMTASNLVIVGATGMVGGYALRYALEHSAVAQVTAIGRKLGVPVLEDSNKRRTW